MDAGSTKSIVVIGVGNWYRSDDAVGIVVACRIKSMRLPEVVVVEESGEGAALMEAWKGSEDVIVVDAVSSGSTPGTIHTLDAQTQSLPTDFFHYSSHAFSVAEAIELARALKQLPPRLSVLGIEGRNFASGVGLSAEVEHAADRAAARIADHVANVTVEHRT